MPETSNRRKFWNPSNVPFYSNFCPTFSFCLPTFILVFFHIWSTTFSYFFTSLCWEVCSDIVFWENRSGVSDVVAGESGSGVSPGLVWPWLDKMGLVWPWLDKMGLVWPWLDKMDLVWPWLDKMGMEWPWLDKMGLVWPWLDKMGLVWSWLDKMGMDLLLFDKMGMEWPWLAKLGMELPWLDKIGLVWHWLDKLGLVWPWLDKLGLVWPRLDKMCLLWMTHQPGMFEDGPPRECLIESVVFGKNKLSYLIWRLTYSFFLFPQALAGVLEKLSVQMLLQPGDIYR